MTSERPGNLPIRDLQRRMAEQPARPDLGPNPTWEQILASDPDHEPHLDKPEGRFEAVLNIVKNGGMVLEVMAMDRNMRDFHDIYKSANELSGFKVNKMSTVTRDHLIRTIARVGAAARSDVDDQMWQLTTFGEAIKPALMYVWGEIIEHDIDPAKAFGSSSMLKKDDQSNIITSSPYSRARIVIALASQNVTPAVELVSRLNVTENAVLGHIKRLISAGLVNFESVDTSSGTYTSFKLTDQGKSRNDWPVYKSSRGYNLGHLSTYVHMAIRALDSEGNSVFSREDVIDWVRNNLDKSWSETQRSNVNSALTFYSKPELGLLQRSVLNAENQSNITLTEKGRKLAEILEVLRAWCNDRNSAYVNNISGEIVTDYNANADIYRNIAGIYTEKSPFKNRDPEAKRAETIVIISRNPGMFTVYGIARTLDVSPVTVHRIIKQLIQSGEIQFTVGKGGRKYLSMAGQEKPDSV